MKNILLIFLTLSLYTTYAQKKQPKPNFVVILVDDLGFSDIGCYGSEIATLISIN
ncbi:MAG: hypothetical protein R2822_22115 [Spirosomataceae bacterium]